jgi:hypothetical protein
MLLGPSKNFVLMRNSPYWAANILFFIYPEKVSSFFACNIRVKGEKV